MHGLAPLPTAHLPGLSASLDYTRRECAAASATIELLIDGLLPSCIRRMAGIARSSLSMPGCLGQCTRGLFHELQRCGFRGSLAALLVHRKARRSDAVNRLSGFRIGCHELLEIGFSEHQQPAIGQRRYVRLARPA